MVSFRVTDYGTPEILADKMFKSGERALNIIPISTAIAFNMMEITYRNFTSEGRRGGGSWKRLADSTVAKKGHSQILVDTGDLQESVTRPDAQWQILDYTSNGFQFGTQRPWAFVHQYGSSKPGRPRIPARPFLRFLPSDEARWRNEIAAYILRPFTMSNIPTWQSE